jgi:hypothetical protein
MRPGRLNAVMAGLFMAGSFCFALGALPPYFSAVGAAADALTFFVGSLFFTLASFAQLVQAQSPEMAAAPEAPRAGPGALVLWAWLPRDREWLSAATQFPGTLEFNMSTLFAVSASLTVSEVDRLVWRPDIFGSVFFLVSSAFGIMALRRVFLSWDPGRLPWWIAWLNMLGSLAFMASALASYVLPATKSAVDPRWVNLGTFAGAVCFFVGAALLLPAWGIAAKEGV